jgi:DNA-binding transcriptional ArsR family regulator
MGWRKRPLAFVSVFDLPAICTCRVRLELLLALAARPSVVTALARTRQLDLSHVSHHLHALASAGLVEYTQHGQGRVYRTTSRTAIVSEPDRVYLTVTGDDGSSLRLELPLSAAAELGHVDAAVEHAAVGPTHVPGLINSGETRVSGQATPGREEPGRGTSPRIGSVKGSADSAVVCHRAQTSG